MNFEASDLKRTAIQLLGSLTDAERHAITIENNETVTALAYLACVSIDPMGLMDNNRKALNCLRVIAETLFALGYRAGQQDNIKLDTEIWGQ